MKMKESKYPKTTPQAKSDLSELSGEKIEVNEKLVGEMWSNASGEFAPTKDLIIGDVHGHAKDLQKALKDIGFETPKNPIINVGSPPEKKLEGEIPDLSTVVAKVRENMEKMQKQNDAHHNAQYKKMYPPKKK
jgi:hypothetical protein